MSLVVLGDEIVFEMIRYDLRTGTSRRKMAGKYAPILRKMGLEYKTVMKLIEQERVRRKL